MLKKIYNFFSNIETRNRIFLSRHKFLYALIGGAGAILYWRGVWHLADDLYVWGQVHQDTFLGATLYAVCSNFGSMIFGALLLLSTGLLVSEFIGDNIIMSGIKKEKKIIDRTEEEVLKDEIENKKEENLILEIDKHLHRLEEEILDLKNKNK